ncbi:MAG: hypothetical protein ABIX28_20520 [Vicinamibacterales bacterium]
MTVLRETVVLPLMFLTVALLGGLRLGAPVRFIPPPLIAVVVGLLTMAALVRAAVLEPRDVVGAHRRPLENLSGTVLLLALGAASVQVFTLLTPDRGLLHLLFGAFFLIQLLTTLAGTNGRTALLRSLTVLFGAAFILRYIVFESLYAPTGGTLTRVLTVLLEGVSLGALQYEPAAPATGYLAFLALVLYLVGLFLLRSHAHGVGALAPRTIDTTAILRVLVLCTLAGTVACGAPAWETDPADGNAATGLVSAASRERSLSAARVWQAPAIEPAQAALGRNPTDFPDGQDVTCRFVLRSGGGRTPKFYCRLPDGEVLKVKYGAGNGELHAEVIATRLLSALGFSADRMLVVRSVRCVGCPVAPFPTLRCLKRVGSTALCAPGGFGSERVRTFAPAVIERRLPGRVIEASEDQGWAWFELDRIHPSAGGSPATEVDALRLFAALLGHWDNKAENQRLLCPPGQDLPDGGCAAPVAVVQDVGATFGPLKLDLPNWRATPVWQDAATCRVSLTSLPFAGGTFPDWQISEGGRTTLARLLDSLSESQLTELFIASGATTYDAISGDGRRADQWVAAFRDKARQVRDAGPCPTAPAASK